MTQDARLTLLAALGCVVLAALAATSAGPPAVAAPSSATPAPAGKAGAEPDIAFVEDEQAAPSGTPANPFGSGKQAVRRKDAVPGYIELSDGVKHPGRIYTTRAKRLKIYNLKRKIYEFVPVPACKRIDVIVEWERMDRQWRFKEAGNPEKVYTGRAYPLRMLAWRLTLRNDHQIVGHILGQPLYATRDGKAERFILHKRDKGPMGAKLDDLIYIRRVVFGLDAYNKALEELKAHDSSAEGQDTE